MIFSASRILKINRHLWTVSYVVQFNKSLYFQSIYHITVLTLWLIIRFHLLHAIEMVIQFTIFPCNSRCKLHHVTIGKANMRGSVKDILNYINSTIWYLQCIFDSISQFVAYPCLLFVIIYSDTELQLVVVVKSK